MYSDLTVDVVPALESNYAKGRTRNGETYKVCKITPHHMSGKLTGLQCGRIFQRQGRMASSNYGIGYDGEIVGYVDEENRAWTSSNWKNDIQAITIECSNASNSDPDWPLTEATWNSLIKLCVDICRRYGFRLTYDGTPNGSLTRHNMFADTDCPGPWLQRHLPELAEKVNKILDGAEPIPVPGGDEPVRVYQNGSTPEPVYADTNLTKKIGSLNPRERCDCFGEFNGRAMVRFQVDGTNNYKIGFCKWLGGIV